MNVVSALSDFTDLAPPQSILGLLLGNIHQENVRKYWSALLMRHKCRRAPAFSAATREFYAERRSYINLTSNESRYIAPTFRIATAPRCCSLPCDEGTWLSLNHALQWPR